MAYPDKNIDERYELRDYNFADLDQKKLPMNENLFKNGYRNADESEVESVPDAHEQNWLFDVLHRNLRYTLQTAEENKRLLETKIATPTNIGQVKIGYGLDVTSTGVLSVVKGVAEDANIISYDLPVGAMMLWAGTSAPEYFIEPTGQTLLRSNYPELWSYAQNNNLVGDNKLFGNGDGSTTFTVTDCRDQFLKIAESSRNSGSKQGEGLPNLTGNAHVGSTPWGSAGTGVFTGTAGGANGLYGGGGDSGAGKTLYFDASKSNSIYGSSSHVTPKNIAFKLILKAKPTPPTNAVPVGTIMNYTNGNGVPDGYIIANGAELSRTTFSNLFNWVSSNNLLRAQSSIPNTAHAYYGTGNGSTTFTIPDLRGVFTRYADLASNRGSSNMGDYQADGLPNHTHYHNVQHSRHGEGGGGAIVNWSNGDWDVTYVGNPLTGGVADNSIYGASSYVQPKNVSIIPLLKY